jgi:hypothetical protein
MNKVHNRQWKKTAVTSFKVLPPQLSGRTEETLDNLVEMVSVPAKSETGLLSNTSRKRYHLNQVSRLVVQLCKKTNECTWSLLWKFAVTITEECDPWRTRKKGHCHQIQPRNKYYFKPAVTTFSAAYHFNVTDLPYLIYFNSWSVGNQTNKYNFFFLGCRKYFADSLPKPSHPTLRCNHYLLCVNTSSAAPQLRRLVAGFPPRRPGFKPGSGHVGFCDGHKWRWGRFYPRASSSPANVHSTIIFTITRGWHNRPGVDAVPIASQTRIKKKTQARIAWNCSLHG